MNGGYVVGTILIVATIVWFFLVGKPWAEESSQGLTTDATNPPLGPIGQLIGALIDFAKKLKPKYIPGLVLLFAGLIVVGFAAGSDSETPESPTTSTTTTTAISTTAP